MEQDEKQIVYCKLKVQSGQAQPKRKLMLWELGVNSERQPTTRLPQVICGMGHVPAYAPNRPMA